MTQRERSLFVGLLIILGIGAGMLLVYTWFVAPLRDYNRQLTGLEEEIDAKDLQYRLVQSDKKILLEKWQPMSLPSNPDRAANEYGQFLLTLIRESGLLKDDFVAPPPAELKAPVAVGAQPKKAGHTILSFTIRGKGTLSQIVHALEVFQKTPLMHRVKSLTLARLDPTAKDLAKPNPKLTFNLVAEAMIVNNAHRQSDKLVGPDTRLVLSDTVAALVRSPVSLATASWGLGPAGPVAQKRLAKERPDREYSLMERQNIFSGPMPLPPDRPVVAKDGPDPREFVQLVSTTPTANYAHLRNRLAGFSEIRIGTEKGFQFFRIVDEASQEVVKAKVLKVDLRDVYFMVGEDPYAIHIGETLAYAMRRPVSDAQLTKAGILESFYTELRNLEATKKVSGKVEEAKKKGSGKKR